MSQSAPAAITKIFFFKKKKHKYLAHVIEAGKSEIKAPKDLMSDSAIPNDQCPTQPSSEELPPAGNEN